jgi:tight adherence protein C
MLLIASLVGFALMLSGLVLLVVGLRRASASVLSHRLQEFVTEAGAAQRQHMQLLRTRQAELSGSFRSRILVPVFKRLAGLIGTLTPSGMFEELKVELAAAGNPLGLGPREFYGIRLLFAGVGFWVAWSILRGAIAQEVDSVPGPGVASSQPFGSLMTGALALLGSNYLPKTWLRRRARKRKDQVARGLPDALDMLSVCADAGLGFDQSLQRVSEYWKTPLGIEFGRVVAEMRMGVARRRALRSLAERLEIRELSSFVTVILQSDQLGMSITETLHSQAEQMRVERRFKAQEQARKMPLKMLFPLLLFIFPAMFAVILGPMIPALSEFFATLRYSVR